MRSYTGTFTYNNLTYKYSLEVPDALVFIYSKHVYCKVRLRDSNDDDMVGVAVQCLGETRYTDASGYAYFDLARRLQLATITSETTPDKELNLSYVQSQLAKNITLNLTIKAFDTTTTIKTVAIELINGANDTLDKFWMNKRRLRWFRNYPFTFDYQNINGNWQVATNGGAYQTTSFPYVSTTLERVMARIDANVLWAGAANVTKKSVKAAVTMAVSDGTLTTNSNAQLDLIACEEKFDLERRCYLRWIGKHGEIFYWLFRRHSETDSVQTESERMAMVSDLFNTFGILDNEKKTNYGKDTRLTVYSWPLDDIDYETVKSITSSPYVDMLVSYSRSATPRSGDSRPNTSELYEYAQWQRVKIAGGTYTKSYKHAKDETSRQMVLTIELPQEGGLIV